MKKIKTIGIVAPSGDVRNINEIYKKIEILEKNFKVKKLFNLDAKNAYLSDSDENRARYFEEAFLDEEIDLVISIRGGYGALRIIDKINYEKIKNSNKYYLGSSDATLLLMALSKNTNIKCFHGLMISNGFVENLEKNIEIIENDILNIKVEQIKSGKCKGKLWGGNLSTLVSVFSGEQFLPDENIILFIEDLNEPLYKIDKMFYELYRNEKLKEKMKGIIFGDFYLEDDEILPLIKQYSDMFNIPSFYCKDITHKMNNVTLPYLKEFKY